MKSDILFIEILNWKKFNGRGDVKTSTWLRLQNSLAFDPEWDHFNGEEIWVWVFLLCLASLKNREIVEISETTIQQRARVSAENVSSSIHKLINKKCIRLRGGSVTRTLRGRASTRRDERDETDVTRRDETDVTNTPAQVAFDFESLALKYPTNKGRQEGISRAKQTILNQEDFDLLSRATENYAERCRVEETPEEYVMHFSTFIEKRKPKPYVQPWRDWITYQAPKTLPKGNNAAYRRMEGNQLALQQALDALGDHDEQKG